MITGDIAQNKFVILPGATQGTIKSWLGVLDKTEALKEPVKLEGAPIVDLAAMTTGTDGDFLVRLIDVFPEDVHE